MSSLKLYPSGSFFTILVSLSPQFPKEQKSLQKFQLPLDLLSQITFLSKQSSYAVSVLGYSSSDLFLASNLGQELFSKLLLALSCKTANLVLCTVQSQLQHCRSTKCQQQNVALVVRIQEKKGKTKKKKKKNLVASMAIPSIIKPQTTM